MGLGQDRADSATKSMGDDLTEAGGPFRRVLASTHVKTLPASSKALGPGSRVFVYGLCITVRGGFNAGSVLAL